MPDRPIRLAQLARVLAGIGRTALRDGAELRSITLSVVVTEPPVLDPAKLWRLTVASSQQSWFGRVLVQIRQRLHPPAETPAWPRVRLVWENHQVFAQLEATDPDPATNHRGV